MPDLDTPEKIADEIKRRRIKMETASREYYELLEEVTHANYTRIFINADRELHQPKTEIIQKDTSE